MRDIPIFTTEFGVSSLVLREIPYRNEAYIHIRSVQEGSWKEHMSECVAFCRMAGADRIYACGEGLGDWPVYTQVLSMRGPAIPEEGQTASVFPVTEQTVSRWRQIHNDAMRNVDNAGTLEARDEKRLLDAAGACFVHRDGRLLGIGWVEGKELLTVAAVEKGAGSQVMHTLMTLCPEEDMTLEVASTNHRAIALYERLGFVKTGIRCTWHEVTALK